MVADRSDGDDSRCSHGRGYQYKKCVHGNSTGGREALSCATRYGKYYDGIISNNPTANYIGLRLWGAIISSNMYASYDEKKYPHSDGFIPEDIVKAISAEAIARALR